ncbi:MAG: hypothetical protein ABH850_07520 [Candidatus Micrarchaeota archaeon]
MTNTIQLQKRYSVNHSPTLNTVFLVEDTLQKAKECISVAELKRRLPKKIMHSTLMQVLDYLQLSGKIVIGTKGVVWAYTPPAKMKKLLKESVEL